MEVIRWWNLNLCQRIYKQIMKKNLYIEPYIGEFGWELFCWQGLVRKRALENDYEKIVVACKTGHDFLYRDFSTEIINFDLDNDEEDMWNNKSGGSTPAMITQIESYRKLAMNSNLNFDIIKFDAYKDRWWDREHHSKRQKLISFERYPTKSSMYIDKKLVDIPDVLICIRQTQKCNTGFRNWPISLDRNHHIEEFLEAMKSSGLRVACIGKSVSAAHVEGTEDLRDISLDDLTVVMTEASVLVAPVSGTIHLAALCGLPQVTWATKVEHIIRAKIQWNPFNVRVHGFFSPKLNGNPDGFWEHRLSYTPLALELVRETHKILKGENK